MSHKQSEHFWRGFADSATRLRDLLFEGDLDGALTAIESLLSDSGYDVICEITRENDAAVLILTPEGDPVRAAEIDSLLSARPAVPQWRFHGRRQRKPLQDAYVFVRHIFGVDVHDARFLLEGSHGEWKVTLWSPALASLEQADREGLVWTFLWHALGEDQVMSKVPSVAGVASADHHDGLLTADELLRRVADG